MWKLCGIWLCSALCFAQVKRVWPASTWSVEEIRSVAGADHKVELVDFAVEGSAWAVLVNGADRHWVVKGDFPDGSRWMRQLTGVGERVYLDGGEIFVLAKETGSVPRRVERLNRALEFVGLMEARDWPPSNMRLLLLSLSSSAATSSDPGFLAAVKHSPDDLYRSETNNLARWIAYERLSEALIIYEDSGEVAATVPLQVDEAYRRAGLPVPVKQASSGLLRISWSFLNREGRLGCLLARSKTSDPAYLAIFDVGTGALIDVVAAELPTSPDKRDRFNPQGVIFPTHGRGRGLLGIGSQSAGVIAFYRDVQ
jgi:hypothetical protein